MKTKTMKFLTVTTALTALLSLSACADMQDRIKRIGKAPAMESIKNPQESANYRPVNMPMPPQETVTPQANSLWQASRQTFFKDQRANRVGDILTVMIDINDVANMKNKTERKRDGTETVGAPNFLGFETKLGKILPDAVDPASLASVDSSSTSTGDGKIERGETIKLKMAAMVIQTLPNGNFVIQGRQQVRVNYELRDLQLQGVIRPEDILNNNSISYEKIAEARIAYGGQGNVSDIQQTRYGHQLLDAILPF